MHAHTHARVYVNLHVYAHVHAYIYAWASVHEYGCPRTHTSIHICNYISKQVTPRNDATHPVVSVLLADLSIYLNAMSKDNTLLFVGFRVFRSSRSPETALNHLTGLPQATPCNTPLPQPNSTI